MDARYKICFKDNMLGLDETKEGTIRNASFHEIQKTVRARAIFYRSQLDVQADMEERYEIGSIEVTITSEGIF